MVRHGKSITLVLGGVRSGKSRYAQELAAQFKRVVFIATARPTDLEMRRKIAVHRRARPSWWKTIEAPVNLGEAIRSEGRRSDVLLIDCLTLYLGNAMKAKNGVRDLQAHVRDVCESIRAAETSIIAVSNEVGCGIVPAFRSGRIYRDLLGELNQQVAGSADKVILMVAGVPVTVKDRVAS